MMQGANAVMVQATIDRRFEEGPGNGHPYPI